VEANLPDVLNVLFIGRVDERVMDRVRAVAPGRLNVDRLWEELLPEIESDWPPTMASRRGSEPPEGLRSAEEREALVQGAHVIYMNMPFPRLLPRRATNLLWGHFSFAGVSNLMGSAWWDGPFQVTSTRGLNNTLPIAESVIGAVYTFARRFDAAVEKTLAKDYEGRGFPPMKLVTGKTMGIIGLGGIGAHVARIARGCGMRVVATRRSATERQPDTDGVDVLYPPSELHEMLAESDYIAICVMWTPETERMLDEAAFAALKPGAYLLNIARGEIVDEAAMIAALQDGRLAGAYLDVWNDDLVGLPPSEALKEAPNVLFTPHTSGRSDSAQGFSMDLFCRNLERLLAGQPLENAVDWSRGY
jgi:phosphoglycerate dehydrogenase-like enzyme